MPIVDQTFFTFLKDNNLKLGDRDILSLILQYFKLHLNEVSITMLEHCYEPECYRCPSASEEEFQFRNEILNLFEKKISAEKRLFEINAYYLFPLTDEKEEVHLLFKFYPSSAIEFKYLSKLCTEAESVWRLAEAVKSKTSDALEQEVIHLADRLTHDLNALASMSLPAAEGDDSLRDRIAYSHRLSRSIMLYLRDLKMHPARVSVKELIGDIVEELGSDTKHNIELNFIGDFGFIQVDVEHIAHALSAIIENAITASMIAGGQISIFVRRIRNKSLFVSHDWLEISVQDNGAGIPSEFLPEIKKPFFTTWKDLGHIGLGLSQAEKIATAHGGALKVFSKPAEGTFSIIYLPIKNDEN
jgi:signal transduction histidine kinase